MISWNSDEELFKLIKEHLYTAVVGDIMDKIHLYHQFLSPRIRPLKDDMVVVGRAMTVLEKDVDTSIGSVKPVDRPFGYMLDALDDLKHGEVYLCSGASDHYALIGEIMMTRAHVLGAAGAVVNGYSRDTQGILNISDPAFPVFSYGHYAQDQAPRGQVIDYRVPLEIDGVHVTPGDLVFGDMEGVLVVPQKYEEEILMMSFEKAEGERTVLKKIQKGMSALDAWNKYGIM